MWTAGTVAAGKGPQVVLCYLWVLSSASLYPGVSGGVSSRLGC